MAGIASIGAAVTAYLTIVKLTGNSTACSTGGCDIVLSSPYATVFRFCIVMELNSAEWVTAPLSSTRLLYKGLFGIVPRYV
jgi:uncharacterized membrane protein